MIGQVSEAETADPAYKSLYKLGGAAAWIVAGLTLGEVIVLAAGQAVLTQCYRSPWSVADFSSSQSFKK